MADAYKPDPNLVFSAPAATSADLVFGADDSGAGDHEFVGAGRFAELRGVGQIRPVHHVAASARFAALRTAGALTYDNAVPRLLVSKHDAPWQVASRASGAVEHRHGDAPALRRPVSAQWQRGMSRPRGAQAKQNGLVPQRPTASSRYEAAVPTPRSQMARWVQLAHAPRRLDTAWRVADMHRTTASSAWKDLYRLARPVRTLQWQVSLAASRVIGTRAGVGLYVPASNRSRWQEAVRPRPGVSTTPVEPPSEPCYTPDPNLVFSAPWPASADLVFVCEKRGCEEPGNTIVIPILRSYIVVRNVSLVRLPDGLPIEAKSLDIAADRQSWAWDFSATCHASYLSALTGPVGEPVKVMASVNGTDFVFLVESIRRTRAFASQSIEISGRSLTAALADPFAAEQAWTSTADRTAQQLMASVIGFEEVGIHWRIDDWLVPAGAWSFSGTPIAALSRIAESAGAYLQSHKTDASLLVLPRYPTLPWEWQSTTPDVQLPLAAVTTESYEPADKPEYNAVVVTGQNQGVTGTIKRAGSDGSLVAPQVVDALATAEAAVRGRGRAVLGEAGPQASHALTLQVMPEVGVIDVGRLIEVVGDGSSWRGLVEGVRINVGNPKVRQTITVERHQ